MEVRRHSPERENQPDWKIEDRKTHPEQQSLPGWRPGHGVNFERTGTRRRKVRLFNLIRLFGGILVVLVLIETGRSVISNLMLKPFVAKWGTIEKGFWTGALFLRDETLITAPVAGELNLKEKSGSRVPRGELVAEVGFPDEFYPRALHPNPDPEKTQASVGASGIDSFEIRTTEPGFLFFQYDGWEEQLGVNFYQQLGNEDFERGYRLRSPATLVHAGEIIGKIINPFQQLVAFRVDMGEETGIPKEGSSWWIKTPEGLNPILFREQIPVSQSNQRIFIFEDRALNADSLPDRFAKIYVVYRRVFGICIPDHALFKGARPQNGEPRAFYVKILKGAEQKPQTVRVLETDGINAIVEGIEFGTVIITR